MKKGLKKNLLVSHSSLNIFTSVILSTLVSVKGILRKTFLLIPQSSPFPVFPSLGRVRGRAYRSGTDDGSKRPYWMKGVEGVVRLSPTGRFGRPYRVTGRGSVTGTGTISPCTTGSSPPFVSTSTGAMTTYRTEPSDLLRSLVSFTYHSQNLQVKFQEGLVNIKNPFQSIYYTGSVYQKYCFNVYFHP